ncbi:MFS transporter [Nocardia sp. NRRL S-836]|uniref:MFS transporter n=1 Tax=Nocardia sp. NRRL S-836 TaxID=1519492 RepID=UPI0006B02791|nr:MFS transporter [Nocardia sp. NRRL S-836]
MDKRQTALICAGTALVAVCYGFARFAYGLFTPVFRQHFALDATLLGVIGAGSYVSYGLAITAGFVLTNRYGPRVVAAAAGALAAAGTALVAAATGGTQLAVGVLVAGASTGLASPPLAEAIARAVDRPRQDRAQSVVNAGTGVGVLLSGPIAVLLLDDWRLAWATFAVLSAAVTAWILAAVPRGAAASRSRLTSDAGCHAGAPGAFEGNAGPPRDIGVGSPGPLVRGGAASREPSHAPLPGAASRASGRNRLFGAARRESSPVFPPGAAPMLTAAFLLGVASSAVWTFGRDVVQAGPAVATVMWSLIGLAGLLGAFSGHLTGGIGLRTAWPLVLVVLSAATAALALWPSSAVLTLTAAALFGASYLALSGLLLVWSTRVHRDRPATGVGTSFLMIAAGQAAGALLAGVVVDGSGHLGAFLAAAAAGLLGAAVRPGEEISSGATRQHAAPLR